MNALMTSFLHGHIIRTIHRPTVIHNMQQTTAKADTRHAETEVERGGEVQQEAERGGEERQEGIN